MSAAGVVRCRILDKKPVRLNDRSVKMPHRRAIPALIIKELSLFPC